MRAYFRVGLGLLVGHALIARPADACSCPGPFSYPLYPTSGTLPANGALAVEAHLPDLKVIDFTGASVPYDVIATHESVWCKNATTLLRPLTSFEVGSAYRVVLWPEGYDAGAPLLEFTAAPPVAPSIQVTFDLEIAEREPGAHAWVCGSIGVNREAIVTLSATSTDRLFLIAKATSTWNDPALADAQSFVHQSDLRSPNAAPLDPVRLDVATNATTVCVEAYAYDAAGMLVGSLDECSELPAVDAGTSPPSDGGVDGGPPVAPASDGGGCRAAQSAPPRNSAWLTLVVLAGAVAVRRWRRLGVATAPPSFLAEMQAPAAPTFHGHCR